MGVREPPLDGMLLDELDDELGVEAGDLLRDDEDEADEDEDDEVDEEDEGDEREDCDDDDDDDDEEELEEEDELDGMDGMGMEDCCVCMVWQAASSNTAVPATLWIRYLIGFMAVIPSRFHSCNTYLMLTFVVSTGCPSSSLGRKRVTLMVSFTRRCIDSSAAGCASRILMFLARPDSDTSNLART